MTPVLGTGDWEFKSLSTHRGHDVIGNILISKMSFVGSSPADLIGNVAQSGEHRPEAASVKCSNHFVSIGMVAQPV